MNDISKKWLFQKELTSLINKHSMESVYANTPDFLLSEYIMNALNTYAIMETHRGAWWMGKGLDEHYEHVIDLKSNKPIFGNK